MKDIDDKITSQTYISMYNDGTYATFMCVDELGP
jgi:hypothetical protein